MYLLYMSKVGERRDCPSCHEFAQVVELVPNKDRGEGWYIQKLSCGHMGYISIMDSLVETVKIEDKVKATKIDHTYGQVYSEKTSKDSRSILCKNKNCGHPGTQHKFLTGYNKDNHNCYLCDCPNYL